ncbi:MAG TPA: hypothetical protein VES42_01975 [Pilimelia sp.]|nr:hypothetical protein [Pilimelia sp.]
MALGDLLRRLDRRVVPPLGDALHRLGRRPGRARRLLFAAPVALVAVLLTTGHLGDRRSVGGDDTVGDVVRVGVPQGRSIPGYVEDSRRELAALTAAAPAGETFALVTLAAYRTPDQLAPVVDGVAVSLVYARVPLARIQTEIVRLDAFRVPADVVAGMRQVARRKEAEALEYHALRAKLTDRDEQERAMRTVYSSGARVAAAEAMAYAGGCSCAYAVVVRATPAALAGIARRPGVRAVDPAPDVHRLDRAVFLPPLPEQADVVRSPVDDAQGTPGR